MISDVLCQAAEWLDAYLKMDTPPRMYAGAIRDEVVDLVARMEALIRKLDAPPAASDGQKPQESPPAVE